MHSDILRSFSLEGMLDQHRRSLGEQIAVTDGDLRISWRQLAERVDQLANALEDQGVKQGDRILWLGQNAYAVLEGILAVAKIGAMFCPVNWRQTPDELAFVIDDLRPAVTIWHAGEVADAIAIARNTASFKDGIWLEFEGEGDDNYEHFIISASPARRQRNIDISLPCCIIYTAAFLGKPNGTMLTQISILLQNVVLMHIQNISHATVFLNSGPLFHVGTLMITLSTFHLGGRNVFIRRSNAEQIAEAIDHEGCTLAFVTGKTVEELVALNADGKYNLKSLMTPSQGEAWDRMITVSNRPANMGYGQTECNGLISWTALAAASATGRFGVAGPLGEVAMLDTDSNEVPQGETGEIAVRGPLVMAGYFNRPDINATRQREGWHRTNDLGRFEVDGSITFVGPKTQMIKSGVENIYPAEVEGCLRLHPEVADCAVIGVPDERFVQSVKAIIVAKPGNNPSAETIIEHCRTHIASYKKPKHVAFVKAIPRNDQGSIDYVALDLDHGGGGYPGGATRSS